MSDERSPPAPLGALVRAWGPLGTLLVGLVALILVFLPGDENLLDLTTTTPPTTTLSTTTTLPAATTTSSGSTVPAVSGPSRGGSVVYGMVGEPEGINPLLAGGGDAGQQLIGQVMWAAAFRLDGDDRHPVPVVVEAVPSEENGGLTRNEDGTVQVRYSIRPEARWEDGTPITADDFLFTYELVTDRRLPIAPAVRELYQQIVPGSLQGVGSRLTYTLATPTLRFLELFRVIVPKRQVEETDFVTDWSEQPWMSAGPFRFVSWQPGVEMRFAANPNAWLPDSNGDTEFPWLDQLVFSFVEEQQDLVRGFRSGRHDIVQLLPDPELVAELDASAGSAVQVVPGLEWEHVAFEFGNGRFDRNPASLNEFDAFRQAVARLVDRSAIAASVYQGMAEPLPSFVGLSWGRADADPWSRYQPDLAEATELLASLGSDLTPGGQPPTIVFSTTNSLERQTAAGLLLQGFAQAGIELQVDTQETGAFFNDFVIPGSFDLAEWAWTATPGPAGAVRDLLDRFVLPASQDGFNFYRWGMSGSIPGEEETAELRAEIEELQTVIDLEALATRLAAVEEQLAEQMVILPLFAIPSPAAVRTDRVGGYRHTPGEPWDTWNAGSWYRVDS